MGNCKRFKNILFLLLVLILAACSSTEAVGESEDQSAGGGATDYPTEEITMIVHTSAGGPTDTMVRMLAKEAEPILGQPIIVENKKGGSGAAQMAALQAGDSEGYTLASITPTHVGAWNSSLEEQFSADDFAFVTRAQLDPYVLAVNADSEFETLEDLVAYMEAHPGEVKVGGYGAVGSGHNIAWNIFADTAGVEGAWANYESTSDAVTALLGNHIDVANTNPGEVQQYVESGELKVLGVFNDERLASLPDSPTYAEAGYDANVDWAQFRGIYTNGDVPEEVLQKLSDAFEEATNTETFQQFLEDSNTEYGYMDHQEFTEFINKQTEVNNEWLEKLGIN